MLEFGSRRGDGDFHWMGTGMRKGKCQECFLIDCGCSRSMAVETERDIQSRRDGRRVHIGQCLVPSDRNQTVGKKLMTWPNGSSGNEPTFRFLKITG